MPFVKEASIPLFGTLRAKRGSLEMEVVGRSLGIFADLKGHAGRGAVAELQAYLMYLKALRPRRLVVDVSRVSFIADPVFDALLAFQGDMKALGGEFEFVGLKPQLAECFARDCHAEHFPLEI